MTFCYLGSHYRMCRLDIYSSRLDLGRHGDVADKDYLGRLSGIYAGVLTNDSSLISSPLFLFSRPFRDKKFLCLFFVFSVMMMTQHKNTFQLYKLFSSLLFCAKSHSVCFFHPTVPLNFVCIFFFQCFSISLHIVCCICKSFNLFKDV